MENNKKATNVKEFEFWVKKSKKYDSYAVNVKEFGKFLNHLGFYNICIDNDLDNPMFEIVHIERDTNIVTRFRTLKELRSTMIHHCLEYLTTNSNEISEAFQIDAKRVYMCLLRHQNTLTNVDVLFEQAPEDIHFFNNDHKESFFFFKDYIVIVDHHGPICMAYEVKNRTTSRDRRLHIWRHLIIQMNYADLKQINYINSPFSDFIMMCSNKESFAKHIRNKFFPTYRYAYTCKYQKKLKQGK